MSILDNEEKILNNSDWVVERTTVYNIINELRNQLISDNATLLNRINDLENKNDELRAELDFIKRNTTISKQVDLYSDFYQQNGYFPTNIRF